MERTQTAIRSKWQTVGLIAIAAALVATLLPAGFAEGSDGNPPVAGGDPSVVYLTMVGRTDEVTWEARSQAIRTKKNDCTAVSFTATDTDDLLNVTAINGDLGERDDYMGVKSEDDGSGEPCIRVEAADSEALEVTLGSDLDGYLMTRIDVDLELKFDATVRVYYTHEGEPVYDETFNPTDDTDDGPDSKDGDNWRYYFDGIVKDVNGAPVFDENGDPVRVYFDTVKFVAESGSFSLGGGSDLANSNKPGAVSQIDSTSKLKKSSQFEVVKVFDGLLACSPLFADIGDGSVDPTYGTVVMHSQNNSGAGWITENCTLKPYDAETADAAISYVPVLANVEARYTMVITVKDQAITTDPLTGQITSLVAEYDPKGSIDFSAGSEKLLKACLGQPNTDISDQSAYDDFWKLPDVGLLPADQSACFYSVSLTPTGADVGTEVWGIYFEDDPGFSFR